MNMNLYIVSVDLINGLYPIVLDVLSLIAIFSGVLVITTKNPIVSVLFLISLFLVIAVNLIFIGVHFIGLAYLLVYIGAISILFLFTIMLMNIRISDLVSYSSNSLPLAFIFALIIFNVINYSFLYEFSASTDIDLTSTMRWDGELINSSHIASIGNIMYSSHAIWLILMGVILLLAMVGSIVITLNFSKGAVSPRHRINLYKSPNLIGRTRTPSGPVCDGSPKNLRRRKGSPPKWET